MRDQRWARIIPTATIMYSIAFINRTNVSLALPSMSRDIHMDALQGGSIVGIFFWGYLLLQVPGGYLASRWSTKWFVSILLIGWGIASMGCGLVRTWQELWAMRFLLGVTEGGMYPATLVLIAHWFPRRERATANAWFSLALPLSLVVSAPLTGWMLDRWNWRVMLVAEGLLPLLCLFPWILGIFDYPRQAPWISEAERDYLEAELRRDIAAREPANPENYWRALLAPQVLLLALLKLLTISGQLGYVFWLPSAIEKVRKISNLHAAILYTIPFIVGAVSMIVTSWHSDRTRERRAHVGVPMAMGGMALIVGVVTTERWPVLAFVLVCLAAVGAFAQLGPFWAIPSECFSPKMAGSIAGFVNGIGQLGGYFGPLLVGYLNKRTGSFAWGFSLLGAFMLVGSVLPLFLTPPPTCGPTDPLSFCADRL